MTRSPILEATLVGQRYAILAMVGAGGMGTVYEAQDRKSGERVAVKVVAPQGLVSVAPASERRFAREGRLLASLSHPAIVRHLSHGHSAHGFFIAMEWLNGEDLAARLTREMLSLQETLTVVARTAGALAVAHRSGVVHRDVKPSNLFLVDRRVDQLKVVDFGVARSLAAADRMTGSGAMLGTVGYMAPEQALSSRDADGRSDVFSLGCVFYECVVGRPAFEGDHPVSLLASLMLDEPPRVNSVRPDLPPAIDALVAAMMAKDRAERLPDMESVIARLEEIGRASAPAPARPNRSLLAGEEHRVVSLILVDLASTDETRSPDERVRLERVAEAHGAELVSLGSSYLVLFRRAGEATDQASRAGSCALAIADRFPTGRIALATGRAGTASGVPLGPGVQEAAELLASTPPGTVRLDPVTTSLLAPRFHVDGDQLQSEAKQDTSARKLLGNPTSCVGRRKELRLLRDTLEETVEERCAQAIVLTAPAGTGKSRVRHELLRGVRREDWTVLEARARPLGAGSALMLASQLIECVCSGTPSFDALLAHLSLLSLANVRHTAEFLGEVIGLPSLEEPSHHLRGAREDARLMADWMERSFVEWLHAEAQVKPVLIALEDLHWGDSTTVSYLGRFLTDHPNVPCVVLALARPEIDEVFPRLWSQTDLQRMELSGLSRRASASLVQEVLGPDVAEARVAQLVERANGNAFFLEELIRHASTGADDLPATVLAMMESRLTALDPPARRVLQIASIFGEQVPAEGLQDLLEGETASWVDLLLDREVFRLVGDSRQTLAFRHGLIRDAAYAMLSPADRREGHRLVAERLEADGEANPIVMIEHHEAAGQPLAAVPWYRAATGRAYQGGDLKTAERLGLRGIEAGAAGEVRGELQAWLSVSWLWNAEFQRAVPAQQEAMALLPRESTLFFLVSGLAAWSAMQVGKPTQLDETVAVFLRPGALPTPTATLGLAFTVASVGSLHLGERGLAVALVERMQQEARHPEADRAFQSWAHVMRTYLATFIDDDVGVAHRESIVSVGHARASANPVVSFVTGLWGDGMASLHVGDVDGACAFLDTLQHGEDPVTVWNYADSHVGFANIENRRLGEALESAQRLSISTASASAPIGAALGAAVALAQGRAEDAYAVCSEALARLDGRVTEHAQSCVYAVLCRACLELGLSDEALRVAELGMSLLGDPIAPYQRSEILVGYAQALMACGRGEEAHDAIAEARRRLLKIQRSLPESFREGYVRHLDSHRRTMELASAWLDATT